MTEQDNELLLGKDVQRIVKCWANRYSDLKLGFEDMYQWGMLYAAGYFQAHSSRPRDRNFFMDLSGMVRARLSEIREQNEKKADRVHGAKSVFWELVFTEAPDIPRALWVREAMAAIPDYHRRVLELVHVQGMNTQEAGRYLGVTGQTIRNHLGDAEENLRAALWGEKVKPASSSRNLKPFRTLPGDHVFQATKPGPRCSANGCDRAAYGRGLCGKHWARWRKHGDANVVTRRSIKI